MPSRCWIISTISILRSLSPSLYSSLCPLPSLEDSCLTELSSKQLHYSISSGILSTGSALKKNWNNNFKNFYPVLMSLVSTLRCKSLNFNWALSTSIFPLLDSRVLFLILQELFHPTCNCPTTLIYSQCIIP